VQELTYTAKEFGIPRAGLLDVRGPLLRRRLVQGSEEQGLGVFGVLGHSVMSLAFRVHLQCGIARQITPPSAWNLRVFFSRWGPGRLFSTQHGATPARKTSSDPPLWQRCRGRPRPGESSDRRSSGA